MRKSLPELVGAFSDLFLEQQTIPEGRRWKRNKSELRKVFEEIMRVMPENDVRKETIRQLMSMIRDGSPNGMEEMTAQRLIGMSESGSVSVVSDFAESIRLPDGIQE